MRRTKARESAKRSRWQTLRTVSSDAVAAVFSTPEQEAAWLRERLDESRALVSGQRESRRRLETLRREWEGAPLRPSSWGKLSDFGKSRAGVKEVRKQRRQLSPWLRQVRKHPLFAAQARQVLRRNSSERPVPTRGACSRLRTQLQLHRQARSGEKEGARLLALRRAMQLRLRALEREARLSAQQQQWELWKRQASLGKTKGSKGEEK